MKAFLVVAAMMLAGAVSARAENAAALASQDPLTAQIRLRQLTEPNGGVTGFRVDQSGKVVQIQAVELGVQPVGGVKADVKTGADALAGLKVHKGLLPKLAAARAKGKAIERPKAQLDHVEAHKKW